VEANVRRRIAVCALTVVMSLLITAPAVAVDYPAPLLADQRQASQDCPGVCANNAAGWNGNWNCTGAINDPNNPLKCVCGCTPGPALPPASTGLVCVNDYVAAGKSFTAVNCGQMSDVVKCCGSSYVYKVGCENQSAPACNCYNCAAPK
jgi:hypothetical protein